MSNISMKNLLEAGVHFGHQKKKWNPKMEQYIFGVRNNIHIIDLQKTVKYLKIAHDFVRDEIAKGGLILFVGTKRQAQVPVFEEAKRCGMYYVNNRWLGGLMTNFATVSQSIKKLKDLEALKASPTWEKLSKKEIARLSKEYDKLNKNLAGIKDMPKLPDMIFVIDVEQEKTAIKEAKKLGIPVVAIVDTNCDPDEVDVVVPGNDDAIRAIKLFASIFADAVIEGKDILSKGFAEGIIENNADNNSETEKDEEDSDEDLSEDEENKNYK
jgi:small subunit ribosomal protein S2